MLKCPRCKQLRAYLVFGISDKDRRWKQKHCNCGYTGRRIYRPVFIKAKEG